MPIIDKRVSYLNIRKATPPCYECWKIDFYDGLENSPDGIFQGMQALMWAVAERDGGEQQFARVPNLRFKYGFPSYDRPDDTDTRQTDARGLVNFAMGNRGWDYAKGRGVYWMKPDAFPGDVVEFMGMNADHHCDFVLWYRWIEQAAPEGQVEIRSVLLEPTTLTPNEPYGVLLRVTMQIYNGTHSEMQTQGPEPGKTYVEGETFQTIGKPEVQGTYRVGLDYEGRTGIDHPYRWGLGSALAPGETVTVEGFVELHNVGVKKYWAGLVQEQERWVQDHIGEIVVTVTESPRYHLTVNTSGQGTVTISPQQDDYAPGSQVTLTATPADDWRFSSWGGTISDNPLNVTMSKDLTLTAVFTEIETPPSDDVAAHLAAHDQELLEQAAQMEQIRQKQAEIDAVFADIQSKLSTQGVAINDIAGWRQRIKDS